MESIVSTHTAGHTKLGWHLDALSSPRALLVTPPGSITLPGQQSEQAAAPSDEQGVLWGGGRNGEQVGKRQVRDNRATRGDPRSRCCPRRG